MSLQFIIGSSGAGKSHYLYESVIKQSIQEEKRNFLIIVPEQFTLQTQKDLVTMHPKHGIMNIDVLSFMRLAYHVFDEVGGNQRLVLEDTGKSMIVKKVAMDKKNELILFGANVRKQGFIEEMKSMISELLQYSIHADELEEMLTIAKDKKLLSNKLKDISTIYHAYEDFLKDRYINAEELLDVVCTVIDSSSRTKDSVICLDGFTGFTPSQYKLLSILLRQAKTVYVTITMDERQADRHLKEHELFYLSCKTMEKMTQIAAEAGVEVLDPIVLSGAANENGTKTLYRYLHSEPLAALEHNIFRYPYQVYKKEQDDITITAAKNPTAEVRHTVIEIQRLIREENYRYKDIAVVSGDVSMYGDLLLMECNKAKIPCFVDNKKTISSNPVVEMIRSAMDIAEHNFSYESVMRFLKCGLTGFTQDAIEKFENYLIAQGIRGYSMYQKEWTRSYRSAYEIDFEQINGVRERLVTELKAFYEVMTSKTSTVREIITALYELMSYYRAEEQIVEYAELFKQRAIEEDRQRAKEYDQVYRLVLEVFDRIVELLGDDVLTAREMKDILETGLKEIKVGLIPPGVDQVLIGDIERTRLKDIKALFFIGVNDGIVPKANPGGGILSDVERQLFADHSIELSPTKRQNAYMTEFYLYLNMTKPQNRLYLSFAKMDGTGKALRTSYLISKILKLFPNIALKDADITDRQEEGINQLLGTDFGLSYLITSLRDYDGTHESELFHELYRLYLDQEADTRIPISDIWEGIFYQNQESNLTKEVAKKLYGETLLGSVTRMEKYAACAFSHFLEFGLGVEERKEFTVSVPDIGNIFHEALERFSNRLKQSEYNWHTLPKDVETEFGKESVVEAVAEFGNGILESSKRNAYLVNRVERILLKTVDTLANQLRAGKFEPVMYEQFFAHADRFLNLHGRIDRMDVYEDENKLYVKVIDYKSGSTSFDLVSLYYGLQLQLGVYLSAAIELMESGNQDKQVIPAGVFYYNLDDPIVAKTEDYEEEIKKKLRMNGLVNASKEVVPLLDSAFFDGSVDSLAPSVKSKIIPVETSKTGDFSKRSSIASMEQFKELQGYINELMHHFSIEIMEGRVRHNPYQLKSKEACTYCKYASVCGFDCKIEGYKYRKLREISPDDIWKKIDESEENADGTDDMDTRATKGN